MAHHATTEQQPDLYIAVIGDLVASRQLADRAGAQVRLTETLEELNGVFPEAVRSRFVITLGDEFQGLLYGSAALDEVWWRYFARMHTIGETRFGFGVGPLATAVRDQALGMDGPCFHAARAALERAHDRKRLFAFSIHQQAALESAVDAASLLLEQTIRGWTAVQAETVSALAELGSQLAVARQRQVTPQSVSDAVRASRGVACMASWQGVADMLRWWVENQTGEGRSHG